MVSFIMTLKRLLTGIWRNIKEPIFLSLLTTLILIVFSGTMFYTKVENWTVINAIYFSIVSLIPTSLDTGLSPQTNFGKIFTIIYLIVGVGVMMMLLVMIGKAIIKVTTDRR
ncbi:ion channel [Paenibacillus sp. 1001270B_150601_E10]|uniref:ion channel n=1 Tax=Paenibacillus sp. 1001270B_150601_E10 TaxID=2787079 RepID=UPI00189ECE0E|nr:ion channel [Paenibacillus sp. 1001270B_150601_E10]